MILELVAAAVCFTAADYERFLETPPDPLRAEILTEYRGERGDTFLEVSGFPFPSENVETVIIFISPDLPDRVGAVFADKGGCLLNPLGERADHVKRGDPTAVLQAVWMRNVFEGMVAKLGDYQT